MKISNFQLIVIGLCIFFIIAGVGVFAAFGGLLGGSSIGSVTIWGTEDGSTMNNLITTLHQSDKSFEDVSYVQKDPGTYYLDLVNAMASGTGPDLFLVSQDELASFTDKIIPIPYSAVSEGQFTGSYIDEGQLFLTPQGSLALPFSIDPLVMYWNSDIFAAAGLAQPPQYWNDFLNISPKITSLDTSSNVTQSAVALGEWNNVNNAKAVLSALFMQAGDSIVVRNSSGALEPVFGQTPSTAPSNPASSALLFYTEFADPSKTTYSWNSALPDSNNVFAAGDLGVYFGFASEYSAIAAQNPDLHFAVAVLPQLQGNTTHLTFGNMDGVAISRGSRNPTGALVIAEKLTSQQAISLLTQATGLPPVRRDVVLDTANNAAASVFVESSLIATAWLDPDPQGTDTIFQTMINSVLSGAEDPSGAVAIGAQSLSRLFSQPQ